MIIQHIHRILITGQYLDQSLQVIRLYLSVELQILKIKHTILIRVEL